MSIDTPNTITITKLLLEIHKHKIVEKHNDWFSSVYQTSINVLQTII